MKMPVKCLPRLLMLLMLSLNWAFAASAQVVPVFAKGADVSWITQMEAAGYKFYDANGVQQDCFQILKDHGINAIRLRVWVNPADGWCGKNDVVAKAIRAKNLGFRLMIDFHYSDSWADPGKQTKPAAWQNFTFAQLKTAVYDHTADVLTALKTNGITPEWVQVGNETNDGMLWPEGRASTNMANFAALVSSGYDAVKAVSSTTKVIVHVSNGFDNGLFRYMFDGLKNNNAKYDVIGMSHYPTAANWPTLNSQIAANLNDMVTRYGKEVLICEVGMQYSAPQATQDMLTDLLKKTRAVSNAKGLGVFYWEPEAYNWQNYSLGAWNTNGRPTIALDAFLENPPSTTPDPNLATNSGFEYDGIALQTPTGWATRATTDSDADKTEGGGHTGTYRLTHYKATAYQVSTYQLRTGLANGTYTLKAWVQNGGGQKTCQLYASDFGGAEKAVALPVTATWTQIQITGIQVTNGQCEIGLLSEGNAGNYCSIDDIEFGLQATVTGSKSAQARTTTNVFPNPVRDQLSVEYQLEKPETVEISLYTITGQFVATLLPATRQTAGKQVFTQTVARNVSPGLYLLAITHGEQRIVRRVSYGQ
ncbi:glycosyl hydrolase 53 family protein [Hymenobacter sp. BT491]|uniref:glycosyl hydrolase 53 family protein n=1 Tax=Hymenobacter sp. BT491 TaxID=2766779 RepID=UPI0016537676|nr:glycosyl hydrolase 53 family protein [Hymenobacter sp. BT491]MBC6988075.1 glycosyl hydrolase 53 family protein [Hymenobacter sp. BT491]